MSQTLIVDNLWPIISIIIFLHFLNKISNSLASLIKSKLLVASSNNDDVMVKNKLIQRPVKDVLENILEAEIEEHLGRNKYERKKTLDESKKEL